MQARERTQEMTLHVHKMEAASRLSGGIAHDVNHLVAIIEGASERSCTMSDAASLRELIRDIGTAATRARQLVRRLSAFARRGGPSPELFDAGKATSGLLPVLRQVFSPDTLIDFELLAEAPVWMDRSHFDLALINIATNARDAMDAMDGVGRFTVRVERSARGGTNGVGVVMTDNGPGMSAAVLKRICEPFFTTKPPGEGTGLGLAMVQDVLVKNGGELAIASRPGAGTSVTLWLPEGMHDAPQSPLRVLMVERNDDRRDAAVASLEGMGCLVVAVAEPAEAEMLVEYLAGELDVILAGEPPGVTGGLDVVRLLPADDVIEASRRLVDAFRPSPHLAAA
jgi:signal transduction histidine kinase